MPQTPNEGGGYPPIQEGDFRAVPSGMAEWPEELPADTFYANSGFVTLEVADVDGVPTVLGCEPNTEALEAWRSSIPPGQTNPDPPSEQERMRADIDFLAALQGVIL